MRPDAPDKNRSQMKPRKKKKRQFRQAFAHFLQHLTPYKKGSASFTGQLNTIAILAQEKLGDCVLLTPLIRNLRKAYPKLEIHIIAFSRTSTEFFKTDPDVNAVHQAKRQPGAYRRNVLSMTFDVLFNTKDHPSTHFLLQSVLIRARYKVGHANEFHKGLFDRLLTMKFDAHMVLKNCALLDTLGIPYSEEDCRPSLAPQPLSSELCQFLQQLENQKITGINISAGEPNRTWPETKWKALLNSFPERQFVVLSGPGERKLKKYIEQDCPNTILSPPTKNLFEVLSIVQQLELLVTPDTSLIHIASATKTPVVGLYRQAPQDISRFSPFRISAKLVISSTGDVEDIEIETVAMAVEQVASASIGKQP